jgi:hypothetical protein
MRIVHLTLDVAGGARDCAYPIPRQDVAAAYANLPLAGQSGFVLDIDVPPGLHKVTLRGLTDTGEMLTREFHPVLVVAEPLARRGTRALRHYAFALAAIARQVAAGSPSADTFRARATGPARAQGVAPRCCNREADARRDRAARRFRGAPGRPLRSVARAQSFWRGTRGVAERACKRHRIADHLDRDAGYRPDRRWFSRALATIRGQVHERWELCIADDASGDPACGTCVTRGR